MSQTQQVEEIKSEFISLNEFLPNWTYVTLSGANLAVQSEMKKELGISIANGARCIIGEAHDGENYKDCDFCHILSYGRKYSEAWDVGRPVPRAIKVDGRPLEFMKLKKEIYSHMIDNHPEKMRKA